MNIYWWLIFLIFLIQELTIVFVDKRIDIINKTQNEMLDSMVELSEELLKHKIKILENEERNKGTVSKKGKEEKDM